MAINVKNSNYGGEVLEKLLTVATTGNELVEKGLIRLEPGVSDKYSIPRLKTGEMLQKRKEQPTEEDSKGDHNYSEVELKPADFMAFTTFNPRSFEKVWRPFQPKGNLVFAELPSNVQDQLLSALAAQVKFELGYHFIQGVEGNDDKHLFNGIFTRMLSNLDVIRVTSTSTSMIARLKTVKDGIPIALRANPNLVILMSIADFDQYDEELTAQPNKGANYTDMNVERYKGIRIVKLANWPSGVIAATVASMNDDSNIWGAVNLQDDMDVIQIDKLTNAGERYFFKMLMKADTNLAFGEECILLDCRTNVAPILEVYDNVMDELPCAGGAFEMPVSANRDYTCTINGEASWLSVYKLPGQVLIVATANTTAAARTATVTLAMGELTETITVSQEAQTEE